MSTPEPPENLERNAQELIQKLQGLVKAARFDGYSPLQRILFSTIQFIRNLDLPQPQAPVHSPKNGHIDLPKQKYNWRIMLSVRSIMDDYLVKSSCKTPEQRRLEAEKLGHWRTVVECQSAMLEATDWVLAGEVTVKKEEED